MSDLDSIDLSQLRVSIVLYYRHTVNEKGVRLALSVHKCSAAGIRTRTK